MAKFAAMTKVIATEFSDLYLIEPHVFGDARGYFFESYNQKALAQHDIHYSFVQDNQSFSKFGTLRGLHFQTGEWAQTKLIRVLKGKILDVVVDLRKNSQTFKKTFVAELSSENFLQLLVPKGFAHGFLVLSPEALVAYKCDQYYNPQHESGIHYSDAELSIDWPVPPEKLLISEKDLKLSFLKDLNL